MKRSYENLQENSSRRAVPSGRERSRAVASGPAFPIPLLCRRRLRAKKGNFCLELVS